MSKKSSVVARVNIIEAAAEEADDFIMRLCEPEKMSVEDAFDFLEQVIERCRMQQSAMIEACPELEL